MRRKHSLPWRESFFFQTKLLQQSFLESTFVSASFRATGEEDFCPCSLCSPPASQCQARARIQCENFTAAVSEGSWRATAWPCQCSKRSLGGLGARGALVHPKRWHFSSRAVPPGPVTLRGFIPRAGPGRQSGTGQSDGNPAWRRSLHHGGFSGGKILPSIRGLTSSSHH